MATTTLLIPRVIARQLTEIAQLGKFSVFPATPKCSHWAVYDSHKNGARLPVRTARAGRKTTHTHNGGNSSRKLRTT